MTLRDRYQVEHTKWDTLAQEKLAKLSALSPTDDFCSYARRSSTLVGVWDFLDDLRDEHVLEFGCGTGYVSSLLAKSGAKVTAFDLSMTSVAVAHKRAELNQVNRDVKFTVAAGETLPYADESFDVIFGKAILHHLEVKLGRFELYRVLKTGGKAVFVEPMGMNPVLNFVREYVPYPHKNPHGADRPVNYDEIHAWGRQFGEFRYHEIQLLSMLERGLGFNKHFKILRSLDDVLLKYLPFLRRYCRYVVMFIEK